MQKSSRRRTYFLFTISILVVAVGISAYFLIFQGWDEPLGPSLELPTVTPAEKLETSTALPTSEQQASLSPTPTSQAAELPTATQEPRCGGPETMLVLAIGADSRTNDYNYGLADVIRIVRIDFVTPKVTVLSIPRDLWVEIPEISDHYGITHGKLNQSYFYGNPGMGYYDGPGAGPGLLARTLQLNFDISVDHYIAVNMRTFEKIVDAVGGIDVYLPEPVDGRPVDDQTEDMGFFPAGQHHFTGEEALRFSRIRKVDTVFHRMDRQTQVICALKEKVLSPSVIGDVPSIIAAFYGQVLTDLSKKQLLQMACLAPMVRRENLILTSLPRDLFDQSRTESGSFIWDTDFDVIKGYIEAFTQGNWPSEPDEPSCPS
jgi:LCP family protein required for cell wall assembly